VLKKHQTQSTQRPQSCFLERFSAISADSALTVRFFSNLLGDLTIFQLSHESVSSQEILASRGTVGVNHLPVMPPTIPITTP
jgi:hypothetical protein